MVKVRLPGAAQRLTSYYNIQQNTDRTARTTVSIAICRTFVRSVFTLIITRVGDSITRISRIATAGPTSEIGGFAGFLTL
jgi:hypothetical protein